MPSARLRQLPGYTCPDIDGIIKILEELRKDNAALRELAETFAEEADMGESDLEKATAEVADLTRQVKNLEHDLEHSNNELEKLQAAKP